jgi:hypothetical protein
MTRTTFERLHAAPITRRAAKIWIESTHRHLRAPCGDICRVALVDEGGSIRAVGMAGRPSARALDDGLTLEITRVASDGAANACSMIYGALRRAGVALGFRRFVTYTLPEEGGASLRASGWTLDGTTTGGQWDTPARRRAPAMRPEPKSRWIWNVKP